MTEIFQNMATTGKLMTINVGHGVFIIARISKSMVVNMEV